VLSDCLCFVPFWKVFFNLSSGAAEARFAFFPHVSVCNAFPGSAADVVFFFFWLIPIPHSETFQSWSDLSVLLIPMFCYYVCVILYSNLLMTPRKRESEFCSSFSTALFLPPRCCFFFYFPNFSFSVPLPKPRSGVVVYWKFLLLGVRIAFLDPISPVSTPLTPRFSLFKFLTRKLPLATTLLFFFLVFKDILHFLPSIFHFCQVTHFHSPERLQLFFPLSFLAPPRFVRRRNLFSFSPPRITPVLPFFFFGLPTMSYLRCWWDCILLFQAGKICRPWCPAPCMIFFKFGFFLNEEASDFD